MADPSIVAFGRYLKIVRERRKLSLEDVAHLTKAYPEPVSKGYLSRVERGLNHVGFSKMVALSRAYEVPLDAFGERYALDLEVDRLRNAPETDGKNLGELIAMGAKYVNVGRRIHAFACVRDGLTSAHRPPLLENYSSLEEQLAAATLGHGVYAVGLGRYRLGAAEVEAAERFGTLRTEHLPIVSYELSLIHRELGDIELGTLYADRAIEEALRTEKRKYLGDAYAARAQIASIENDLDRAVELFHAAIRALGEAGRREDSVWVLLNLAESYSRAQRFGACRRTIRAAQKLERELGTSRAARIELLLGEVATAEGHPNKASIHWHRAIEIARESNDRANHFRAEFHLFKLAVTRGNSVVLNALGRRLSRLAQWMPPAESEVREFRDLYAKHRRPKQRGVAASQPLRP